MAVNRSDQTYLEAIWQFRTVPAAGETNVQALAIAQARAGDAWRDIHTTVERKSHDTTRTAPARLLAASRFAKEVLQKRRTEFDGIKARAADELKMTQTRLQATMRPPSDPGEAALFADIRAHLRGLNPGERLDLLNQARDTGDVDTLRAAVSGPSFLSLIPAELRSEYRDAYLMSVAPNEWGHAQRLTEALDAAQAGQDQLEAHAANLIDFAEADALERSAT